jgi:hypothetical protein
MNAWQQLRLLRTLTTTLIVSMVEPVLTQGKYGKHTFLRPPPSQNGWLTGIIAAQHVWRAVKEAGFAPETWIRIALRTHLGPFVL